MSRKLVSIFVLVIWLSFMTFAVRGQDGYEIVAVSGSTPTVDGQIDVGEEELTTIVSSICGKREKVQEAIQNLSRTKLPAKFKGGSLEYLTLKTFSVLAEKVFQR